MDIPDVWYHIIEYLKPGDISILGATSIFLREVIRELYPEYLTPLNWDSMREISQLDIICGLPIINNKNTLSYYELKFMESWVDYLDDMEFSDGLYIFYMDVIGSIEGYSINDKITLSHAFTYRGDWFTMSNIYIENCPIITNINNIKVVNNNLVYIDKDCVYEIIHLYSEEAYEIRTIAKKYEI